MGGECQRISMFLSVLDVHVQYAPVGGTVAMAKYTMGQFVNALGPSRRRATRTCSWALSPASRPGKRSACG